MRDGPNNKREVKYTGSLTKRNPFTLASHAISPPRFVLSAPE